jgi:pimeloyl-ACP methyl ester carboxylesterase
VTRSVVDVPGGRLLVVDEGSGPPIVLLHAGIADLRSWDAMVPFLTRAGYRAVRYDARGHGESSTEDVEFLPWTDARAVLDALGIGRAVLVGNSLGGMTAIDAAIFAPDRVVAVVGVGAALGGFHVEPTDQIRALEAEEASLEAEVPRDPTAFADFDVRLWVDGPGRPPGRVPSAIREAVRAMDTPLHADGRVAGHRAATRPSASERLADLRCPVLAVAGQLDLPDVVQAAQHLEANAPNARALVWPDVAHMIGMEQPERLAATIVDFLAPLERWS